MGKSVRGRMGFSAYWEERGKNNRVSVVKGGGRLSVYGEGLQREKYEKEHGI